MIRREPGSVTVAAVALIAVVLMLMAGALAVSSAVQASHRARAAADLAALAAAAAWQVGALPGDACRRAADVARANDAHLVACAPAADGSVSTETTAVVVWPLPGAARGTARATARAGPGP